MNRNEARKLAETVSLEDLKQMFLNAQNNIKDWEAPSRPNRGLSLGISYNILSKGIAEETDANQIHILAKTNMIWAFGEFLPNYAKPVKEKRPEIKVAHQDPDFLF